MASSLLDTDKLPKPKKRGPSTLEDQRKGMEYANSRRRPTDFIPDVGQEDKELRVRRDLDMMKGTRTAQTERLHQQELAQNEAKRQAQYKADAGDFMLKDDPNSIGRTNAFGAPLPPQSGTVEVNRDGPSLRVDPVTQERRPMEEQPPQVNPAEVRPRKETPGNPQVGNRNDFFRYGDTVVQNRSVSQDKNVPFLGASDPNLPGGSITSRTLDMQAGPTDFDPARMRGVTVTDRQGGVGSIEVDPNSKLADTFLKNATGKGGSTFSVVDMSGARENAAKVQAFLDAQKAAKAQQSQGRRQQPSQFKRLDFDRMDISELVNAAVHNRRQHAYNLVDKKTEGSLAEQQLQNDAYNRRTDIQALGDQDEFEYNRYKDATADLNASVERNAKQYDIPEAELINAMTSTRNDLSEFIGQKIPADLASLHPELRSLLMEAAVERSKNANWNAKRWFYETKKPEEIQAILKQSGFSDRLDRAKQG